MDGKKILKLNRPAIARGIASGTDKYIAPSQAKDVISREATDANVAAQRKREKATRRKQLAYYMAKTTGGTAAQFEKVINSEDWDDLDVQEMLLEDRFAKFRETTLINTSEEVRAKVHQTNKNATTRKLEKIQSDREFLGKQTGAISSNYEENSNLLTPETVVSGKIKAAGLENELAGVMNKYDSYLSMSSGERLRSFSKEELSIFTTIANTGLTPSKLTSKKSVLDFGNDGGSFDDATDGNEMLAPVVDEYATDVKTPNASLAAIFGSYRESLSGATYDVLPINKKEVSGDLLASEFSLQAPAKYPDYMQPARGMKGITVQQQQSEALGLPDNANVQEYFDNLAEQYIDPSKLEHMSPAEKGKAIRLISMQISKMLPSRLKAVSVQNATSIQANDDKFNELVEQYGVDEAVRMVGKGSGEFIPPTAAYTAYPSPHELVGSINSSKLREFAASVVKRGMTSKGLWTDDESQVDTMSTLLTYGTRNLSYNNFAKQDDEYQRATVARAALTELPKQLGRIYGISDTAVSRKSWGGGLQLNYDVLEQSLDEQLFGEQDTIKHQLDREVEFKPSQLDKYARDELARTVDVFFQPAGDLAADYVDNNLTQVDEYLSMREGEVDLNDDLGTPDDGGAVPPSGQGDGSGKEYTPPTGLEAITRDGPGPVDDSFATAAPSVDMQAVEGIREGASTNQRATSGNNLGESVSTTGATSGSRLGNSTATRAAVQTEFKVPAKPAPVTSKTETIVKVVQPDPKPLIATPSPPLGTRDERLSQALEGYQQQNPNLSISNAPQGSQQWLDERKLLVTASDATRVTGSDRSRNTFVGEKSMENWGMTSTQPYPSEDIERGHRLEDKIRQQYEKQTETEVLEMGLLQSKGFPGGASLDGLVTKDGAPTKRGVEFKAPREFRNFADYHDQVQMQMAVGNLDSVDIMQGVEVDGKLRTQTQTVGKDLDWQKRNRGKIQQAQDSIKRNAAMTQQEFLEAEALKASDKSGKYGYLVSASKEEIQDTLGGGKKSTGGGSGGGGGRKGGNKVSADPSDRSPYRGGSSSSSPDGEEEGKSKGWLSTLYNTGKEIVKVVDDRAQEVAGFSRKNIGDPLDYGLDPGQFLGNTVSMRNSGVSEQGARSAMESGSQLKGEMELGRYGSAISQMRGSLGGNTIQMMKELSNRPEEHAIQIARNMKSMGKSGAAIGVALRDAGLGEFGTLVSRSKEDQDAAIAAERKRTSTTTATSQRYAEYNAGVNNFARTVSVGTNVAEGVLAGIGRDTEFANKTINKLKEIPANVVDVAGINSGGGAAQQDPSGGQSVSYGTVDRSNPGTKQIPGQPPIEVHVTSKIDLTTGNLTTTATANGKTNSTQKQFSTTSGE